MPTTKRKHFRLILEFAFQSTWFSWDGTRKQLLLAALKSTKTEEEEKQEAAVSLAAARVISIDAKLR